MTSTEIITAVYTALVISVRGGTPMPLRLSTIIRSGAAPWRPQTGAPRLERPTWGQTCGTGEGPRTPPTPNTFRLPDGGCLFFLPSGCPRPRRRLLAQDALPHFHEAMPRTGTHHRTRTGGRCRGSRTGKRRPRACPGSSWRHASRWSLKRSETESHVVVGT